MADTPDRGGLDPVELEELIGDLVETKSVDRPRAVLRACKENPAEASRIRSAVTRLESLGLAADDDLEPIVVPKSIGGHRVIETLGSGGMGVVYLVHDEEMNRELALKVIRPENLISPQARLRFEAEMLAAARLQHPSIVSIHHCGEDDGMAWFTMDRVVGCTLADALEGMTGRSPQSVDGCAFLEVVCQQTLGEFEPESSGSGSSLFEGSWQQVCLMIGQRVANALHHAHERGVLHRDVKTSNIMVTPTGEVLLFDFGLARLDDSPGGLTRTGCLVGSLPYMAPEQIAGVPVDRTVDVYGLGVVLYEMMCLRHPFAGDAIPASILARIASRDEVAVRQINGSISWESETVVAVAMDPDSMRRYVTADAMSSDLRAASEGRAVSARRPGGWLRARRWVRRRPTLATAMAFGVVLVAVLAWSLVQQRQDAEDLRESLKSERTLAQSLIGLVETEFELLDPDRVGGQDVDLSRLYENRRRAAAQLQGSPMHHASFLVGLAGVARALGRDSDAHRHDQRALEIYRSAVNDDDRRVAMCMDRLAEDKRRLQDFKGAEALCVEALKIRERLFGESSREVAASRKTLSLIYSGMGRNDDAEKNYRLAIASLQELVDSSIGDDALRVRASLIDILNNGAGLALRDSRPKAARERAERALALMSASARDSARGAIVMSTVASACERMGDSKPAKGFADRALQIAMKVHGTEHVITQRMVSLRGSISRSLGEFEEAIEDHRRAWKGLSRLLGSEKHSDVIRARGQLMETLLASGDLATAEKEARDTLVLVDGEGQGLIAAALHDGLSRILRAAGQEDAALKEQRRVIALYGEVLGPWHLSVWELQSLLMLRLAQIDRPAQALEVAHATFLALDQLKAPVAQEMTLRLLRYLPALLECCADTATENQAFELEARLVDRSLREIEPKVLRPLLIKLIASLRDLDRMSEVQRLSRSL